MTATGWWTGEPPDAEAPAMPVTGMLLANQGRRAGVLETAMARSHAIEVRELREDAARVRDPDEVAAGLIARGVLPGMMTDLHQRLADVTADLEAERSKIAKGERRQEIARREHAAGRIDAWGVQQMLDGDFGDAHRAEVLERRAASLRGQIAEASSSAVPPEARARDALEQATSRAQGILAAVAAERAADDEAEAAARARLASQRATFYGARGRFPFASPGGASARSEQLADEDDLDACPPDLDGSVPMIYQ